MIIDAHAHIFPDKIAEKAVAGIGGFYAKFDVNVQGNGTLGELLGQGAEAGVDRFIVQSVATVPTQVEAINDFISESVRMHPEKLIGFGAMHPNYPDIDGEIGRIISLGLRGIKLHSDFQGFAIDDERAFPIYEAAQGRLPILFHNGDTRSDLSSPERLLKIVKRFPRLTVIGAHFAGWSMWEKSVRLFHDYLEENPESPVFTDCSSSLYAMTPENAAALIRKFGVNRVMWGTDYPMFNAKEELARFAKLPLTDIEKEMVLGGNALRLLGEDEQER